MNEFLLEFLPCEVTVDHPHALTELGYHTQGWWRTPSYGFHSALNPLCAVCCGNTRHCSGSAKLTNPWDKPCRVWLQARWIHGSCGSCCMNISPCHKEGGAQGSLPRGIAPGSLQGCSGVAKEPLIQGSKGSWQSLCWMVLSQAQRKGLLHWAQREPGPSQDSSDLCCPGR